MQWLSVVNDAVDGINPEFRCISQLDTGNQIERILEVIPGPAWLGECVKTTDRKRVETLSLKNVKYRAKTTIDCETLPCMLLTDANTSIGTLVPRLAYRAHKIATHLSEELREQSMSCEDWEFGSYRGDIFLYALEKGHFRSIRSRALNNWFDSIDSYIPHSLNNVTSKQKSRREMILDPWAYTQWRTGGPLQLVWRDSHCGWINTELALEISEFWLTTCLMENYLRHWANAVFDTCALVNYDRLVNDHHLDLFDNSIFFIQQGATCANIISVGSTKPVNEVLKYARSKTVGKNMTSDKVSKLYFPILDMLGASDSVKEQMSASQRVCIK